MKTYEITLVVPSNNEAGARRWAHDILSPIKEHVGEAEIVSIKEFPYPKNKDYSLIVAAARQTLEELPESEISKLLFEDLEKVEDILCQR